MSQIDYEIKGKHNKIMGSRENVTSRFIEWNLMIFRGDVHKMSKEFYI